MDNEMCRFQERANRVQIIFKKATLHGECSGEKSYTTLGCVMEVDSADSRSTSARLDSAQLCGTIFTATKPPHQRPAAVHLQPFKES